MRTKKFDELDFELSYLLTVARLWSGLTQAQLAKKIGTKQPAIARIESGALVPSWKTLKGIARAIGTEIVPPRFKFMDSDFSAGKKQHTTPDIVVRQEQDEHRCVPTAYIFNLNQEKKYSDYKTQETQEKKYSDYKTPGYSLA